MKASLYATKIVILITITIIVCFFLLSLTDVDNIGDVTLTNPEIKCTSPDMPEPEEGSRAPTHDDDIDQAFAMYEKDHPGTRTLHEQLSMLSMVSDSVMFFALTSGHQIVNFFKSNFKVYF